MVQGETLVLEVVPLGLVREIHIREGHSPDPRLGAGDWGLYELDVRTFDGVKDTAAPQGVMALCARPDPETIPSGPDAWVVVADGVQDPGNLGTIMRSAEAAGAHAVMVTPGTVDPWSPKCVRASAGAVLHVPIIEIEGLGELRDRGFVVLGTTSHAGPRVADVWDADLSGRIAVVVGNESRGLSDDTHVDRWIAVPHAGRSESLNVAMAASIIAMIVARARDPRGMSRGTAPDHD